MLSRLFLALALLLFAPFAQAQDFPKLTGRVVDAANIIDPAREQTLTAQLEGLEKQSGRQVVVATVPDLQGYDISDYAYRLGRAWGIGQKAEDDGVVLLIAPQERKVWIATGYGVEGIMTDAVTARIVRNAIIPRFKANDYPGGIEAGVGEITTLLTLPPDEARRRAALDERAAQSGGQEISGGDIMTAIVIMVVIFMFILPMMHRRGGRRFRGGAGPVILWGPGLGGGGWGDSGGGGWGGFGGGGGGGFSGGGGSFGGGGAGGSW